MVNTPKSSLESLLAFKCTVGPRFNEVPRDWEIGSSYQGFVISRFYYYWAEECGSLYEVFV